jgi:hypothetical protein
VTTVNGLNFSGGGIHEIAAMRRDGVLVAGHFDNPEQANAAIAVLADYRAVWSSLNPVAAVLPNRRSLNLARLTRGPRAGARHVEKRASLLLDFDPPRPPYTMSTNEQHEAALTQARDCRTWLRLLGWPLLPLCDSGSGAHLRPTVDMDASAENTRLVQRVLRALKHRYSFVDATASDLPRLCRYYGTMNRKSAENSVARPWRLSRVVDPGDSGLVTCEQIESVIADIGLPAPTHYSGTETPDLAKVQRTIERLALYLDKIGVALEEIVPLSDGRTLYGSVIAHWMQRTSGAARELASRSAGTHRISADTVRVACRGQNGGQPWRKSTASACSSAAN